METHFNFIWMTVVGAFIYVSWFLLTDDGCISNFNLNPNLLSVFRSKRDGIYCTCHVINKITQLISYSDFQQKKWRLSRRDLMPNDGCCLESKLSMTLHCELIRQWNQYWTSTFDCLACASLRMGKKILNGLKFCYCTPNDVNQKSEFSKWMPYYLIRISGIRF